MPGSMTEPTFDLRPTTTFCPSTNTSAMSSAVSPPPKHEIAPPSRSDRPMIVGPDQPEAPYPMKLEGVVTKGFGRGARFLGIPTANLPETSLGPLTTLNMTGIYYGFARVHPSNSTPLPSAYPSRVGSPSLNASSSKFHPHAPKGLHALSPEEIEQMPARTAPYPPDSEEGKEQAGGKRLSEADGKVWPMVMSVGWNPYFKNEKITAEVHIMHPFEHDFYGHEMSVLVLGYIRPELDYVSKEALIEDIQTDVKVALNCLARPDYAKLAGDRFLTGIQL